MPRIRTGVHPAVPTGSLRGRLSQQPALAPIRWRRELGEGEVRRCLQPPLVLLLRQHLAHHVDGGVVASRRPQPFQDELVLVGAAPEEEAAQAPELIRIDLPAVVEVEQRESEVSAVCIPVDQAQEQGSELVERKRTIGVEVRLSHAEVEGVLHVQLGSAGGPMLLGALWVHGSADDLMESLAIQLLPRHAPVAILVNFPPQIRDPSLALQDVLQVPRRAAGIHTRAARLEIGWRTPHPSVATGAAGGGRRRRAAQLRRGSQARRHREAGGQELAAATPSCKSRGSRDA
mmetsp:Transcript_68015/g.196962  ORF Transcript_68015/g.196962 Transcript_68015/m.196962 type:complete len:289 (+) Transcript_68015:591-1457(+)